MRAGENFSLPQNSSVEEPSLSMATCLWCMWREDGLRLPISEEGVAKGKYEDGVLQE